MSSPSPLPIYEIEPALLEAWRSKPERRRFVIEAPTGSGKSTQVPQMLSRHGLSGSGEVVIPCNPAGWRPAPRHGESSGPLKYKYCPARHFGDGFPWRKSAFMD